MYLHGAWIQWYLGRVTHVTSTEVGQRSSRGHLPGDCKIRWDSWFENRLVYPADAAAGSCILLVSSFFWQHFSDLYLCHSLTDYNQTWSQEPLTHGIYVTWSEWVKGHVGSKRSKTQKRYSYSLQGMVTWLMHMHQLDPSTKVITLNVHPGSFGVTGVKRSFSPKML